MHRYFGAKLVLANLRDARPFFLLVQLIGALCPRDKIAWVVVIRIDVVVIDVEMVRHRAPLVKRPDNTVRGEFFTHTIVGDVDLPISVPGFERRR